MGRTVSIEAEMSGDYRNSQSSDSDDVWGGGNMRGFLSRHFIDR